MNKILIDTNVFIDHLRGYEPASDFLVKASQGYFSIMISTITEMELYAGTRLTDSEIKKIDELLSYYVKLNVNSAISKTAGELLRFYRNQGLSPIDALIASSALDTGSILVTNNIKHFQNIEKLLTLQPYPTEYRAR